MSAILTEAILILFLLIANGVFAMSELAVMSARKVRLQQRADEGDRNARAALELANQPDRFLSTVQIGITSIGILAGAFGGATIAEHLAALFASLPGLAPYSDALGLGLVVLVITFLSLIVGELVPKQIALTHPERIAAAVARPMRALARLAGPAVHILSSSSRGLLRILNIKPSTEPVVTEEEVRGLIEQGTEVGTFHPVERDMIDNVLRLGDRRVHAFMTPRTEVVWLDLDAPPETIRQAILTSQHSRFPVGRGSLDDIVGIAQTKHLLIQSLDGSPVDLHAALATPLFIPESTPAFKALELLRQHRTPLALVLDEYGGIEGLVTVNDIVSYIVGDFSVTQEPGSEEIVRRSDGSWLVDGMLNIDDFARKFELEEHLDAQSGTFRTVAGLVLDRLEHIPVVGEHFVWHTFRFEVMDMDGNRIDKLLLSRLPDPEPEPPEELE